MLKGRQNWRKQHRRHLPARIARDRFVNRQLRKLRWIVLRIWEHDLAKNPSRCMQRIRDALIPSTGRSP